MKAQTRRMAAAMAMLLLGSGGVHAQALAQQIMQSFLVNCPTMVASITARPETAAVLQARPLDASAVCQCAGQSFLADARLTMQFEGSAEQLKQRMQSDRLKAYTAVRLTHAVLACLLPELEASLLATDLAP
jgi:hypothetical protein